jgi:hypothetical protein
MATAGGPDIERDGLVFGYDTSYGINTNNISSRFYPGEPTTNYVTTNLETLGTDGSGQGSIGTRTTIAPNHVKIVDINSNTRQNHLISGLTGGTIYTVSIQFKKIEGTPTFRFQLQDYNGGSYLRTIKFTTTAETGLEDKYGWQTASWTFTLGSDANAVRIWWQDGADYTTYTHSFELKNPQLEAKNHVTPYASGTRSSTQSLIDLTRTTTIDVSNVSFDSTGQPTFDGTDDYISLNTPPSLTGAFTVTCWFKKETNSERSFLGKTAGSSGTKLIFLTNNNIFFRMVDGGSSSNFSIGYTTSLNNEWNFLTATRSSSGVVSASINGNSLTTGGTLTGTFSPTAIGRNGDGQYWDGALQNIKIYNRALSADEVQQNYNAYKNRFNL